MAKQKAKQNLGDEPVPCRVGEPAVATGPPVATFAGISTTPIKDGINAGCIYWLPKKQYYVKVVGFEAGYGGARKIRYEKGFPQKDGTVQWSGEVLGDTKPVEKWLEGVAA